MQFTTPVSLLPSPTKLSLKSNTYTIGSCFADVIGSALAENKYNSLINPFGTTYNPYSIHKLLEYAIANKEVEQESYLQQADVHLNYNFHSELSALNKTELKTHIKIRIESSHQFLKQTDWLIITYGSAWVYERKDNKEIVANCHKMPASAFEKYLLSQKKIIESFESLYKQIKAINPDINIILSVSPVRHLKDTFQLNSVSKSVLLLSCYTLSNQFNDVHYFPAYEIMMDELRDYRFYKPDLLHPSKLAETYIWEKFVDTYLDDEAKIFLEQWYKIKSALSHEAFHRSSNAHQIFLNHTLQALQEISHRVDVTKEITLVNSQIIHK
jgi:hypothetical protein